MRISSVGRLCCHVTLALALFTGDLHAQADNNQKLDTQWKVVQAVPGGEAIQIVLVKKGTVRGNLVSSTETAVTVATKDGQVTTARAEIKRVKVKGDRLKANLVGAGAGAAAGMATGAILSGAFNDGSGGVSGSAVASLGAVGAGVGFLVAALRPSYKTIYKIR
jgi:hypothetical protein